MPLRIREVKSIMILDIEGTIDINSADIIETIGWLVNTGKLNIIINLEGVDLIDYSGLSILAIAYKSVMNHKGSLKFENVPLSIIELFKVAKLDNVFINYPDEDTAVNSYYDKEVDKLHLRRKYQRVDIHLKIRYKPQDDKKGKFMEGSVLNISAAGVYVYTKDTLPINTAVDMEIFLPALAAPLQAIGKVAYIADKDIQPHAYPGMGIAFSHLKTDKEKVIIDFIEKNVTHRAEPF